MKNRIICNRNYSLIVNINMCWLKLILMQIYKYFSYPNRLIYSNSSCYIFGISCALSNHILLSWTPREHAWSEAKIIAQSAFHIIHRSCLVTIKIAMKHKNMRMRELYIVVYCTIDISCYSFCALKMWFTCTMHESWEQTYSKCNIKSCCCKIHQTPQLDFYTDLHLLCLFHHSCWIFPSNS